MQNLAKTLDAIDSFVWGPVMLVLLVGTGMILTIRTDFLPWRNLGYALKSVLSKDARTKNRGTGDVSPFAALTTALAATIGTGNIVGVATAMVLGGPGALVWMWISAFFGLTTKFSECMLAIKYRETNELGEMSGGPMYTMKHAFHSKRAGALMGFLFALFTVIASFGIGNLTQANSIASSLEESFHLSAYITGTIVTILAFIIIVGGIKSIASVSSVVVPFMAVFYVLAGIIVILCNWRNLPAGLAAIFGMAFHTKAVGSGMAGAITASMMQAMRWGVARGVFSNEAGLGSAAITAAAAATDHPVRQGYINMTGTFFDTIVVCTITGLAIASSGVLGTVNPATGEFYTGTALTSTAFSTVLGPIGGYFVCIGIALFAFSTIIGWEYHGEKAFEFLLKTHKYNILYRVIFSLVAYVGATTSLSVVWSFSDIANALMALPNLICLLALSGTVAKDIKKFQKIIHKENS